MEENVINLSDLINLPTNELPDFVNKSGIIYCCKNNINGKVYIGETKRTLRERWIEHKYIFENKGRKNITMTIYDAIRKYGENNFYVSILEENLSDDAKRKAQEKYWISKYNSFIDAKDSNGYNMTIGGDAETAFAASKGKKYIETCLKKYGSIPFLSDESRKKANETNRKNHGGILAFQSKESRKKSIETQMRKYGMIAVHLPENKEKAILAMRKKYGDVLPFNTKEAIEKAQKAAPLHRMIGCIKRHIEKLINKGLEINAKNYVLETDDIKHMWQQHIPNVLRKIEDLRKLEKWDENMEKIFSNILYDENERGIKKIKFNDEN